MLTFSDRLRKNVRVEDNILMSANLIGQQIEHYRVEDVIGEGGMGTVYRAIDVNLARPVAIKVMHQQYVLQPEFQQRFQQEAQAAARLEHPSIVSVYHFGREHGLLYIVMELVPGLSLGTYMKQLVARGQVIRLDETILLMAQVADALGYAHRKGVVHRDIKPDNIIVKQLNQAERPDEPPLRAVVTDFGLAKLMEGGIDTQPGEFMGTLAYISPEQILEGSLDGRSDIYSLGVVLFQLATGQLPFSVKTPSEALLKHVHQPPPSPHELQPALSLGLEQIILKALAKNADERYQTSEALAANLRQEAAVLGDLESVVLSDSTQSSVVSMVIELDSDPNLANTSRWLGEEQAQPPGYDRLLISREGGDPEIYSLYKRSFTIGRSEGNDIVLVGSKVSRWHARLEYKSDRWLIADAGSTNGTFLHETKLLQDSAQAWPSDQIVRIGPFSLRLETPLVDRKPVLPEYEDPPHRAEQIAPLQQDVPVFAPPPSVPREYIAVDMRPKRLKGSGICRVLLLNEGDQRTTITVSGSDPLGRLRFDASSKQVTLSPGQKGVVDFYLEEQKRPFIGRKQSLQFRMHVNSGFHELQSLTGEYLSGPVISVWLLLALFVLFLILLLVVTFGVGFLPWESRFFAI
jgi:serine/threonine protein kinase